MNPFSSLSGIIISYDYSGCNILITLDSRQQGIATILVTPCTFILNQEQLTPGSQITVYYDSNAPMPLIYPPQYRAVAITITPDQQSGRQIVMDYFDHNLVNSQGTLQLNVGNDTRVILPNGQNYYGSLANKVLMASYSSSTRSIPAITTPSQIVVFCFS